MIRETAYNEVFDAQQHFRLLMDAMARPGKINALINPGIEVPEGIHASSVLIGFALLNADVSFYVSERNSEVDKYLVLNTSSHPEEAEKADFIFLNGDDAPDYIDQARLGPDIYPEHSAFLIIDVEEINEEALPGGLMLHLEGPGIDGRKSMAIKGLNPSILEALLEKNAEYPIGVDTIFTDGNLRLACVPRSSKLRWEKC